MKLVALFAIVCGCLLIYGFLMADRIGISTRKGGRTGDLDVVITLPSVRESARWLTVMGCSADMDDRNQVFCNDIWDRQSTQEVREDQRQYPMLWRDTPRGLLQISAVVTDARGKTLASGQTRVFQ